MTSNALEEIQNDIKAAMKAHEQEKLTVLRTLLAQIKDATINAGRDPEEADVASCVAKAIKQRLDSIDQFAQGGRDDLAQKEAFEIKVLKKYQPQQMEEAEIEQLVRRCIAESGASGKKDMGKVMQALMPQTKGRADGKLVSRIVNALLSA